MPDREFKVLIVKIIAEPEKELRTPSETLKKEIENIKKESIRGEELNN